MAIKKEYDRILSEGKILPVIEPKIDLVSCDDDKLEVKFVFVTEPKVELGEYTNLKVNLTKLYLDITTSICENEYELCESARDGFSDLKDSFSLTWDFIVSSASEGMNKLKEWYEIWRMA